MISIRSVWLAFVGLTLLASCSSTNNVTSKQAAKAKGPKSDSPFKKYSEVITKEAVSDEGLFTVHEVGDKLYFEIPDTLYDEPMLMISRIAQTPVDLNPFITAGSKAAEQVLRWQRKGKNILLRRKSYHAVADDSLAISQSVEVNNFEPIIMAFDIEAFSADSSRAVIEVTKLFTDDVAAISGLYSSQRREFKVRRLDPDRTFIEEAKSFPQNVNVRHTMTYSASDPPAGDGTGTISMQMYQSMVLLPQNPMTPRLSDHRVGYFSVSQVNYGSDEQKAASQSFIRRWRLEPSDPEAYRRGELVEPVKPIVYYLDPATPEKWRSYFCKGVEDWQTTFETAGFKNAIQCKLPPEDDPEFDPEDVRYSMVRYVATTTRNATGPSVSDPRTGEIIESDIRWFHNHIRSYRNRLMIETGAANPAARSLKIPEKLIGETMRQVIAHEIGHALGLPHNMVASSAYPVDSLRSPTFAREFGVAPTIMDYARQNYIAQPGDGLQPTDFIRQIGPYDHYVINWGYRWYPDINTPEEEKKILDKLILEKAGDPLYRFSGRTSYNPESQIEDLGDDPVKASEYAVANLKRVVPNLIEWTYQEGKDYSDLEELYDELNFQWYRYMGHVATVIGGVTENRKTYNQDGVVYDAVPREQQERALQFISEHVFETPSWMLDGEILRRIEPAGAVDRIRNWQTRILSDLISPPLLMRMIEAETFDSDNAYPMASYIGDLTAAVWPQLDDNRPLIDTYRRNLQRGFLEGMEGLMTEEFEVDSRFSWYFGTTVDVSQSDIRAVVRGQLKDLKSDAQTAQNRTRDAMTRNHLDDVIARIDMILNPEG